MTVDDMMQQVLELFPDALISEGAGAEIIIETGMFNENGVLVSMLNERDFLNVSISDRHPTS